MNAILLGAIAAVPSYFGLVFRAKTNLDDSLDVVAAHGVGGTVGALLTGVFADKSLNGLADGLLYGNPGQLGDPGDRRRRDDRLQRRRDVHPAQGHRRGAPAARATRTRRAKVSTRRSTAKKPTCTRREVTGSSDRRSTVPRSRSRSPGNGRTGNRELEPEPRGTGPRTLRKLL